MEPITAQRLLTALGRAALPFAVLDETDSTNLYLKRLARDNAVQAPYLVVARAQTAGRGRLGRSFLSPADTGLYMSLLLAPPSDASPGQVTILAAVAVCRAIEALTPCEPHIKWVNDIFVNGKKVCGILAEKVDAQVVVGIGVNLITPPGGFPPETGAAGALDAAVSPAALAAQIARGLLDGMAHLGDPAILDAYRARMPLTGREVRYALSGEEKTGVVLGIDADGGLIVRESEGLRTLRSGEVSLGSGHFRGL